jgi:hypothetical protein
MTKESRFYFQQMYEVLLRRVQAGWRAQPHWIRTEGMVVKLTTALHPASPSPYAFMAHIRETLPGNVVMVTRFPYLYISRKEILMRSPCCLYASPRLNNLTEFHNIYMNATPSEITYWNITTRHRCGPLFW